MKCAICHKKIAVGEKFKKIGRYAVHNLNNSPLDGTKTCAEIFYTVEDNLAKKNKNPQWNFRNN